MMKQIGALALSLAMLLVFCASAAAQTLGPVSSYEALAALLAEAGEGDTILLSGDIAADKQPLSTRHLVYIQSDDGATLRSVRFRDASVTLRDVSLADGVSIDGTSHIHLSRGVSVSGSDGQVGLAFSGRGTLIIERGCKVSGGAGAPGVSIDHDGGEFYGSIEGSVFGGSGESGGAGMIISPLREGGAVMISGQISGGDGSALGGHALNLYDLSGNAYITVDGTLQGGGGAIGGDGIQLVATSDNVSVGISGEIRGGDGESYGGNALIMMNAEDSASVNLSGHFVGGSATGADAQPGTALHLVGESASLRARIDNCILEDGRAYLPMPEPTAIPTPEPSPESSPEPTPAATDKPAEAPSEAPSETSSPETKPAPETPDEATPSEATPGEAAS